ncbi:MAG: lipopolysaccharide biosynthesis protein [Bacteroidales bacterium]|jgi:O-antigen/teichoic acid export membrane protein|nr:lipopolysaccharide biosynthesis protein [Bacteroidales bacterium]
MSTSSLKQKTARGIFWGGFSSSLRQLLTFVFGMYMARILNDTDYGMVGVLAVFTGIANALTESGFSSALVNKATPDHKDYNAVFWFSTLVSVTLYVIAFACAPLIALYFNKPELVAVSRTLFIIFILNGLSIIPYTILFKQLKTKQTAIIDVVAGTGSLSVGLLMAWMGYGYWAIVAQTITQFLLVTVLRFSMAHWRPTLDFDFAPLKAMFPFGSKLLITNMFMQAVDNIFSIILGRFYTFNQVGQYTQGRKWGQLGSMFLGGLIGRVVQPALAHANDSLQRQTGILRKLIRFNAFISFPLMLGLAFVAREFTIVTVGDKWLPTVPIMQLFCVWFAFSFLWTMYSSLVFTRGKSDIFMYTVITIGLLQLLAVWLLRRYELLTMLAVFIALYFVGLLVWHHHVYRLIGLRLRDVVKDIAPYLTITLFCFSVAWLLTRHIENLYLLLLAKILISATLYLLLLHLFKSVIFNECKEFFAGQIIDRVKI